MDAAGLADNLRRVALRRSPPRDVISPHSHSVLADPDPELPLDHDLELRIDRLFAAAGEGVNTKPVKGDKKSVSEEPSHYSDSVPRIDLPAVLHRLGFESARERVFEVEAVVQRCAGDRSSFTRSELAELVMRLQAPAKTYGERLRTAAGRGDIKLVAEFVIRGCDANTADGELQTSIHRACCQGRAEVIDALHSLCGGRLLVDPKDRYGCTPLWLACLFGHENCVRQLVSLGADVNATNMFGKSSLHAAASKGHSSIVPLLVQAGALVQSDVLGMTPLHEAAMKVKDNSVLLALLHDRYLEANDAVDMLGYTANDYAAKIHCL